MEEAVVSSLKASYYYLQWPEFITDPLPAMSVLPIL